MLPLYHHLYAGYSPENLFFLKDQVNQGDREDPRLERQRDRGVRERKNAETGREIEGVKGKKK